MNQPPKQTRIFTPCQEGAHDDCVGVTTALYRDHRTVYCGCDCHHWGVNKEGANEHD